MCLCACYFKKKKKEKIIQRQVADVLREILRSGDNSRFYVYIAKTPCFAGIYEFFVGLSAASQQLNITVFVFA